MRRIMQEGSALAPLGPRKPAGPVRVDWGNPITADMVDCLVFNEGAGAPINLATPVVTVNTSSPTWAMTGDGPAGYATGGSSFDIPDHGNIAAGNNTIRILVKIISWPGSFAILFDKAPTGVQNRELSAFFDTSGNVDFYSVGGTAGASVSIATGLMPGAVYDFAMVTASGTTTFYVNGIVKGSSSAGNGTNGAGPGSFLSFGRNISTGGNNADAQYAIAQVWTRALSADELTYLANNPFGFLIPSGGEMPALFKTSSGNAYTLAGAEGAFVINGQAASTAAVRKLSNATGAFVINGQPTTEGKLLSLSGTGGAFVISGQPATEVKSLHLTDVEGAYVINGGAMSTARGLHLANAAGAFAVSGKPSTFGAGLSLKANKGVFVINGNGGFLNYIPVGGSSSFQGYGPQIHLPGAPQAPGGNPQVPVPPH